MQSANLQSSPNPAAAAVRGMFAARKQVFIDLLKWDLPVLEGRYEVDQFDDASAQYLILLDDHGQHRASARLLRTDQPHILGSLYPELCDGPVPAGASTWEITRFCLDRNQTAAQRRQARDELVTALVHHALAQGITDYTGVAELSWLTQILRFGWQCMPLGRALRTGEMLLSGLHIRIDGRTLDGLRSTGIYQPLTSRLVGTQGGLA